MSHNRDKRAPPIDPNASTPPKFQLGQFVRHRTSGELGVVVRRVDQRAGTYEVSAGIEHAAIVNEVALEPTTAGHGHVVLGITIQPKGKGHKPK